MAHLHRVIVALLLWVLAGSAFAALQPTMSYVMRGSQGDFALGSASPSLACTNGAPAYAASFQAGYGARNISFAPNGNTEGMLGWCSFDLYRTADDSYVDRMPVSIRSAGLTCPANSDDAGNGTCTCKAGFEESAGQCVPAQNECQKLAGQSAGFKNYEGQGDTFSFCDGWNSAGGGTCVVRVTKSFTWESPPGSGHFFSSGEGRYTGSKATSCNGSGGEGSPSPSTPKPEDGKAPDTPDPGTAAPAPCPPGQAPGEVNGQRVCAPRGTDGNVTEKSTSSSTNAAGDKTDTTKETKCEGGQCTTTTTNCTTLNGQTASNCTSTSTTGSASGTCKAGSGLAMCGEGSTQTGFSGSCAAGFKAVSDDAVVNAMAEEQYRRNCLFFEKKPDPTADTLAYDAMRAKGLAGVDQTSDLPDGSRVSMSISPGDIDSSNALGASACLTDRTITVWNRSITLPVSDVCPWLGYLGSILMVVAYLVAARIVIKG